MLDLVSQVPPAGLDSVLLGGAGWAGAGLLGGVLWWLLFKHLPKLLEHYAKLLDDKDKQIRELTASYEKRSVESQALYERSLANVCESNERAITTLGKVWSLEVKPSFVSRKPDPK